jgi:hypothetical protein
LQLRLLELNSDAVLKLVDLAVWVEAEHGDGAGVGASNALDALHGRGFAGSVGPDESEDFTFAYFEGRLRNGNGFAVGLA